MNILIVNPQGDSEQFIEKISKIFQEKGDHVCVATQSNFLHQYLTKREIPVFHYGKGVKYFYKMQPFNKEKWNIMREEYDIDFEKIEFAQVVRYKNPKGFTEKRLFAFISITEDFFTSFKPDIILIFDSLLLDLAIELFANNQNIPIYYTDGMCLVKDHHIWNQSTDASKWLKEKKIKPPSSQEEKDSVNTYMKELTEKKPLIGASFYRGNIFSFKRFKNLVIFMKRYLQDWKCHYTYSPIDYLTFHLDTYFKKPFKKSMYFYPKDLRKENYYFFPMHVRDDYQLTYRAYQYWHQPTVVKMAAEALPKDCVLYVKEHPHPLWAIPISWIREMAKIPNVKLLPPQTNAHKLIEHAKGIITINSDVGWEALMYQKPVFVLAKPFYAYKGVTQDIQNPQDLKAAIEEVEKSGWKPKKEDVEKLIHAVLQTIYPGTFTVDCDCPEKIVESLMREIEERKQ